MAGLKEVRNRIKSVISTQQITKAMKMVAAAKLRKAQDQIMQMRPFAEKLNEILQNVIGAIENTEGNDFAVEREVKKVLIVAVTSDRGLCGAFNSNVLKKVNQIILDDYQDILDQDGLYIMPIGKKSYEFYKKNNFKIIDSYWDIFKSISFDRVREAAEFAMDGFLDKSYDKVLIVYNEFKNVATQVLTAEQFLPLVQDASTDIHASSIDYIFEPDEESIIRDLIPQSLKIKFYKAILESNASEHGARMTAMDKATENADEILADLRISYNRSRQAAITKEILEIVGGADALAQE